MARGIDYIEKKVGSADPTVGFPVYDGHGNMVMTISRNGTSFSDGLHRSYDVWGSLRWNPSSSSEIKTRYVANLGHVEDDESGLMYMRARFYEPWTGRFVSEDPARDGLNWNVYCVNNPVAFIDESGREPNPAKLGTALVLAGLAVFFSSWAIFLIISAYSPAEVMAGYACSTTANILNTLALILPEGATLDGWIKNGLYLALSEAVSKLMADCQVHAMVAGLAIESKTHASLAAISIFSYQMLVFAYLAAALFETSFE